MRHLLWFCTLYNHTPKLLAIFVLPLVYFFCQLTFSHQRYVCSFTEVTYLSPQIAIMVMVIRRPTPAKQKNIIFPYAAEALINAPSISILLVRSVLLLVANCHLGILLRYEHSNITSGLLAYMRHGPPLLTMVKAVVAGTCEYIGNECHNSTFRISI